MRQIGFQALSNRATWRFAPNIGPRNQMASASDLESQLQTLIGRYPGFGSRSDQLKTFDNVMKPYLRAKNPELPIDEFNHLYTKSVEQATTLIREWMIAKGIDTAVAYKQSEFTLQNAYKGGDSYLNAIKQNAANQRTTKRFGNVRGGEILDLDLDEPTGPPVKPQPAVISAADIRKAVEQVARPELDNLRRETKQDIDATVELSLKALGPKISTKIEEEVGKLQLGDKLTDEITAIAKTAARQMAEEMLPRRIEIKRHNNTPIELDREPRHEAFDEVLFWLTCGSHVYIVGPKGTGKTHMGKQLRDAMRVALDRADYEVRFIDQSLTKYDVKGFKGPTGEYIGTLVRECVEKGWLMFIDEGDMWAAAALGSLNSILANDFGSFPDQVVEVHPDFRCVLAANTTGHGADREYVGRQPLDAASRDRFSYVTMDYDRKLETQLYGSGPWVQYVWRVRDACNQLKNKEMVPSMRAIQEGLKAMNNGGDGEMAAKGRLWRGAEPDIITKIKAIAGEPPKKVSPIREVA